VPYYKGKVAAEMMNRLGYDAMTVGNHEFDDGPEVLRGFIDQVDFPVLMSNADISNERLLNNVLKPSVVIERGGEEIGLIGLTPEDTADLASPGKAIKFSNPAEAVAREVKKLTDAGVDRIIVLSHSGYQVDKIIPAIRRRGRIRRGSKIRTAEKRRSCKPMRMGNIWAASMSSLMMTGLSSRRWASRSLLTGSLRNILS